MTENVDVNTNLENIDLDEFSASGVSTVIAMKKPTRIVVGMADKQQFFRAIPGYVHDAYLIEYKSENEYYIVSKKIRDEISGEYKLVKLYGCYYNDGTPFLCPVTIPIDGDLTNWNSWHRSRDEVVKAALTKWVRAQSNKKTGAYDITISKIDYPEIPIKETLQSLINLAFKDRVISDVNHPLIKKLRGEQITSV